MEKGFGKFLEWCNFRRRTTQTTEALRLDSLQKQKEIGIDLIPVGDFSLYDHVLDTSIMFGVVPTRFEYTGGKVPLETYFAIARRNEGCGSLGNDEMVQYKLSLYCSRIRRRNTEISREPSTSFL